jgi:hypothetical protein
MSRSNDEEKDPRQLGRRKFLRIGTLGAAGQARTAPETETLRKLPPIIRVVECAVGITTFEMKGKANRSRGSRNGSY